MACLKCGRETEEGRSFCEKCHQVMALYPVKPNTPVHIPKRVFAQEEKKTAYQAPTPKEREFDRLHSCIRWLAATVGIMTVIICLLAGLLMDTLMDTPETNVIGKNYTVTEQDN